MYSIGPYTFTETDARRTVHNAQVVLGLYAEGRDASVIEQLRPVLTGDLAVDLERTWAAWMAASPALRAAGQMPARADGVVAQLNTSRGGLPKLPVDTVTVGWRGVEGDSQRTRVHHGRPWQALCLWSTEVIDMFHAEGHPIAPGLAGENVTISGLPWVDITPGVRLRIGDVLCEASAYALPCYQNKEWFKDGDFELMHHERGPVSRIYATVLEPGRIAIGDPAVLEP
jgi:MOSC domain-containing protein YiiM